MPRIEPIPWDDLPSQRRQTIDAAMAKGTVSNRIPLQIFAYADRDRAPQDGDRHPQFPDKMLEGRLIELLRIRSAQLGGCEPCQVSRKVDSVSEGDVVCLVNPAMRPDLGERERRALAFMDLLSQDHHAINDETYRGLAEVFTTAEIVELGMTCGQMIGGHRFLHTLDMLGEDPPVITYDPTQVGATWNERHQIQEVDAKADAA
jgi:alkylhydroperoxidase family enzyme